MALIIGLFGVNLILSENYKRHYGTKKLYLVDFVFVHHLQSLSIVHIYYQGSVQGQVTRNDTTHCKTIPGLFNCTLWLLRSTGLNKSLLSIGIIFGQHLFITTSDRHTGSVMFRAQGGIPLAR